jgi:hypothetical protein
MHQPWQQFVLEPDIVEFASREYLPNRPDAAAREIRPRSGRLHAIADLKRLRHRACPSQPNDAPTPTPLSGVPSVYAQRRRVSCRDMSIVLSGKFLTQASLTEARGARRNEDAQKRVQGIRALMRHNPIF